MLLYRDSGLSPLADTPLLAVLQIPGADALRIVCSSLPIVDWNLTRSVGAPLVPPPESSPKTYRCVNRLWTML